MAFKLDFDRLGKSSVAERDREEGERRARLDALADQRKAMVEELAEAGGLSDWEARFVDSMRYKATTFSLSDGRLGGDLAYLSDAQAASLERLHGALAARGPSA